jgi:ComF family protein
MRKQLKRYILDFLDLIYPNPCLACGESLVGNEATLCTTCRVQLPRTDAHIVSIESLENKFAGKVAVDGVFSFLKFEKKGKIQRLLHALKYQNRPEVGVFLGQLYGQELRKAGFDSAFDLILPVPLHPRKLAQRGYNQSSMFAEGLSEGLQIAWANDVLTRTKFTETQTHKNRFERFENVADIFAITDLARVSGQRVVLVDDVITTGATLESAIATLWQANARQVWVLTIAVAA